jgi:hypothetical protein
VNQAGVAGADLTRGSRRQGEVEAVDDHAKTPEWTYGGSKRTSLTGAAASVAGILVPVAAACIYHDSNLQVEAQVPGYYWCAYATNAEAWNEGEEHVSLFDGQWPRGCVCLAGCNDDKMSDWHDDPPSSTDPDYAEYSDYLHQIREAAYDACIESAADHDFNNCETVTAGAPVTRLAGAGDDPDCSYTIDQSETGGGQMCEALIDPVVPNAFISCVAPGNCDLDEDVVHDLWYAPAPRLGEDGYARFKSGGLKLYSISSTDIVYKLGLRTGDIVLSVNGDTLSTLPAVVYAILSNFSDTSFNVSVKRGTATLTYHYDLV